MHCSHSCRVLRSLALPVSGTGKPLRQNADFVLDKPKALLQMYHTSVTAPLFC